MFFAFKFIMRHHNNTATAGTGFVKIFGQKSGV